MKPRSLAAAILAITITALTLASACDGQETAPTVPTTTQPSGTPTAPATGTLSIYDNPSYGIRIGYPADWTLQEGVMGAVVAFLSPREDTSDVLQENLNIFVQDLSAQPMTLDEYTDLSLGQIEQLITDAEILDSGPAILAGNPGHKAVYTGKQGQYDLKWMQVWTVKSNKAYVISYTAEASTYSGLLATIQEMIESFEIVDGSGE